MEARAATKPSLSAKKMTIGIGSYGISEGTQFSGPYDKKQNKYVLSINNSNKKAVYTFTSGNKKIATVKKSGTKCYITGVKAGSTNITVKQKLNGKTTTVGKCKVTVKNAKAYAEITSINVGTYIRRDLIYISNFNPAAKYTYESSDENFSVEDEMDEWSGCIQRYRAKAPGTYTVTVKETYKKKTRIVGKVEITVEAPAVQEQANMYMGQGEYLGSFVHNCPDDGYWFKLKDDGILRHEGDGYVTAVKEGTTEVEISYYDVENDKKGDFIGVVTITVEGEAP